MVWDHGEALLRQSVSAFEKDVALYDLPNCSQISAASHNLIVPEVQRLLWRRGDIVRIRGAERLERLSLADQRREKLVQAGDKEIGFAYAL